MNKARWYIAAFVLATFLLLPLAANAQAEKSSSKKSDVPESPKVVKTPAKPPLQSVTLPSTAEAVSKVAEEASAKSLAAKAAGKTSSQSGTSGAPGDAVLEFHPTATTPAAGSGDFKEKDNKNSVLKNIHGSAYGAAASAAGSASAEGGPSGPIRAMARSIFTWKVDTPRPAHQFLIEQ